MNILLGLAHVYFWIAAIGFPLLASHWISYERKASIQDYKVGHDDGWNDGHAAAVYYLRSEEAKHVGKNMKNYDPEWGPTLMSGMRWADWLEEVCE